MRPQPDRPVRSRTARASALGACRLPQRGLVAAALLLLSAALHAACVDEDRSDNGLPKLPAAPQPANAEPLSPRAQLQTLVQEALARNNGIGAARLLTEAALTDVEEARASKRPMASVTGSMGPSLNVGNDPAQGATHSSQVQARAGVMLSQTLFDGGRSDRIIDWRTQQAEAARLGMLSTQEQITLSTTALALERSRFRMQAAIYGQHVRKMGCLVEALETIVAADKGRMSELVQARKQHQTAELSQAQAVSQARQVEAKLRRIAGDGLPGTDGLSTLLLTVPELPAVLASAERATDIAAMDASTAAAREMARVVEAGTRPQVSWNLGGSTNVSSGTGAPRNASVNAGMTLSIPLLNPAIDYSVQAARKRADALALQRADALEQRRQRIVDVHEQATAAFDRLRRIGLVLRDSDKLRNFTLQQWQQLGRRSLFDVMAAEGDHYNLRVQYINALHDGQQMNATLQSLGVGLTDWLR